MGTGRTDEFRKDAVRIALTSGLTRRQVADNLGVGLSTLNETNFVKVAILRKLLPNLRKNSRRTSFCSSLLD